MSKYYTVAEIVLMLTVAGCRALCPYSDEGLRAFVEKKFPSSKGTDLGSMVVAEAHRHSDIDIAVAAYKQYKKLIRRR